MGKRKPSIIRSHGERLWIEFYVETGIKIKYSDNSEVIEQLEKEVEVGKKVKKIKKSSITSRFYVSKPWIELRHAVYKRDGFKCAKCSAENELNIDHILPRSRFPQYSLSLLNLRVLCWTCNKRKAASIEVDVDEAIDRMSRGLLAA